MIVGDNEQPESSIARPAPLSDVRVLDLTRVLAGPYCTYQLAMLGAKVIKVEKPGGEWTRHGGGLPGLTSQQLGLAFCVQNSDKDFVEADVWSEDGRNLVLDLVRDVDVDVFVENYRPGVAAELGFGFEALRSINPSLVYCSISAYGEQGPLGGRPAYDHVVQAASGIMELTGEPGSDPTKVGAPYLDYATGLNGAFAILAALRERDRTGEAQHVDVAMLDTALSLMASSVTTVATTGNELAKMGNAAASGSPSAGCFPTSDGRWFQLVANTPRQFELLCAALDHPEWAEDERWSLPNRFGPNREAMRAEIAAVIVGASAHYWDERFARFGVPGSAVRSLGDLLAEGHPQARGFLHEVPVGDEQTPVQVPGLSFRMNGVSVGPQTAPRKPGSDNDRWRSTT